jgi:hypothetical protein
VSIRSLHRCEHPFAGNAQSRTISHHVYFFLVGCCPHHGMKQRNETARRKAPHADFGITSRLQSPALHRSRLGRATVLVRSQDTMDGEEVDTMMEGRRWEMSSWNIPWILHFLRAPDRGPRRKICERRLGFQAASSASSASPLAPPTGYCIFDGAMKARSSPSHGNKESPKSAQSVDSPMHHRNPPASSAGVRHGICLFCTLAQGKGACRLAPHGPGSVVQFPRADRLHQR